MAALIRKVPFYVSALPGSWVRPGGRLKQAFVNFVLNGEPGWRGPIRFANQLRGELVESAVPLELLRIVPLWSVKNVRWPVAPGVKGAAVIE